MNNGNNEQQIIDRVNKAHRVLIVLPQNPNGDAIGSGLALASFLKKLEKEPELVSSAAGFGQFSFLPGLTEVKQEIDGAQSFVVSVSTANAPLDELSYEPKPDHVDIFLKAKSGKFTAQDVTFRSAKFPYDLVIVIDSPSLENLGALYEKNRDLVF